MPRSKREESPTGYYHVMMRGNNRESIFKKNEYKEYFLKQLKNMVIGNEISLAAYCVMNNHVHLLVHAELEKMSMALKKINIKFAAKYNSDYERVGHVFQDRYKSEIIDTQAYLLQALRYIHNNPVKAKIVLSPETYAWSSYDSYLNRINPELVSIKEKKFICSLFSDSLDNFIGFHHQEEHDEFLEIEEDLEREREEKARRIIDLFCDKYNCEDINMLLRKKDIMVDLIIRIIQLSNLSNRRIANILGIKKDRVNIIVKKHKDLNVS